MEAASLEKAKTFFDSDISKQFEYGSFQVLKEIHEYLFWDVYADAGKLRTRNASSGSFRFLSAIYLQEALRVIENLPESTFDEIISKYVEMNLAHPFSKGNGIALRIWLDLILKKQLGVAVDWKKVEKAAYLQAMERSPVNDLELRLLLQQALTSDFDNRGLIFKGGYYPVSAKSLNLLPSVLGSSSISSRKSSAKKRGFRNRKSRP